MIEGPEKACAAADWMDTEPGLRGAFGEFMRLCDRARERWVKTLIISVAPAAIVMGVRLQQQHAFYAEIVFRVSEGQVDTTRAAPEPNKLLRDYVMDIAFAGPRLLEVIKKYKLYSTKMHRDEYAAVEAMRNDIEIEVARNYFLLERGPDDPPRSARISLAYRANDPGLAVQVIRELARLVDKQETGNRQDMARWAAEQESQTVQSLRDEVGQRKEQLMRNQQKVAFALPAQKADLIVAIGNQRNTVEVLERRLMEMERRSALLDLRSSLEKEGMGFRFEQVDMKYPHQLKIPRYIELSLAGLVGFALCMPLVAMAVGAFDPRVYSSDDVRRLHLTPFGQLPPFAWRANASAGVSQRPVTSING